MVASPRSSCPATEAVRGHTEVVDEACDADGTAAVSLLCDGEARGYGVARRHPAVRTGRPGSAIMPCVPFDHDYILAIRVS